MLHPAPKSLQLTPLSLGIQPLLPGPFRHSRGFALFRRRDGPGQKVRQALGDHLPIPELAPASRFGEPEPACSIESRLEAFPEQGALRLRRRRAGLQIPPQLDPGGRPVHVLASRTAGPGCPVADLRAGNSEVLPGPEPGILGHLEIYSLPGGTSLLYAMRLFIAVPLPAAAAARVGELLGDVRGRGWPVRWVRDGGLHLTLKFFGEVTPDRIEAIQEALGRAARDTAPIELVLGSGGAFPSLGKARVLRLEVQAGSELELLQDRLERACEEIGYPPEGRPFFPHITLGRVREGERLSREAAAELEQCRLDFPFLADRVVLFESRQTRQGPEYTERLVHRFTTPAPA